MKEFNTTECIFIVLFELSIAAFFMFGVVTHCPDTAGYEYCEAK